MPFEGSAFARSVSAEYIHAARERARSTSSSTSSNVQPVTPVLEGGHPIFTIPSPIYGIPRRDEGLDGHSPPSPGRLSRGFSGFSRRSTQAPVQPTIAETLEEGAGGSGVGVVPPSRASGGKANQGSDSDDARTLAGEGRETDLEQGEGAATSEPPAKGENEEKAKAETQGGQPPAPSTPEQVQKKDPYLVTLEGRENLNPHTWNEAYRWMLTGLAGIFVLNATFASSAPSQLLPAMEAYFGFSSEVGSLTISLFVAGYCVGPLLWGPLSERYGRKLVFLVSFAPYTGFQVGCALSKNTGSLLIFRFLGGCFAASTLTTSGGLIADIFGPDKRGNALAIFSLAPFAGPAIAPIVSGALAVTNSDWRWIYWILTIFAGLCLVVIALVVPETYMPYILHKEAKRLRKETGDSRWYAAIEHHDHKVTLMETLDHTVLKPFIMIAQEPMLLLLTLYMSFVYGIVYLLFEAVPIVFQKQHGFNALQGGLCFLALPIGGTSAVLTYAFYFNKVYMKKHHAIKPRMVPPEERLKPLMLAAPLFAISFFWIGWTAYPSISPAAPLVGIVVLGYSILFMFLGIFNYLIDAYLRNAASALAINTVARSTFGAGFPLFASQMYAKLGTPGASSLLGGLALVFMPMPFVLYKYGRKVREMSKNAMVID